jgi:hypothetical protein
MHAVVAHNLCTAAGAPDVHAMKCMHLQVYIVIYVCYLEAAQQEQRVLLAVGHQREAEACHLQSQQVHIYRVNVINVWRLACRFFSRSRRNMSISDADVALLHTRRQRSDAHTCRRRCRRRWRLPCNKYVRAKMNMTNVRDSATWIACA